MKECRKRSDKRASHMHSQTNKHTQNTDIKHVSQTHTNLILIFLFMHLIKFAYKQHYFMTTCERMSAIKKKMRTQKKRRIHSIFFFFCAFMLFFFFVSIFCVLHTFHFIINTTNNKY